MLFETEGRPPAGVASKPRPGRGAARLHRYSFAAAAVRLQGCEGLSAELVPRRAIVGSCSASQKSTDGRLAEGPSRSAKVHGYLYLARLRIAELQDALRQRTAVVGSHRLLLLPSSARDAGGDDLDACRPVLDEGAWARWLGGRSRER
jgi:hypothetical protein